jgi:hypothetical protein
VPLDQSGIQCQIIAHHLRVDLSGILALVKSEKKHFSDKLWPKTLSLTPSIFQSPDHFENENVPQHIQ